MAWQPRESVILSAAKDLRGFRWLDDLRTTAGILRCAQDDSRLTQIS